jgi:hypothetical protein
MLEPYAPAIRSCLVEGVHAMPKQGISSAFRFGRATGAIEGVLAALAIPVEFISPAVWKRQAGIGADKDLARAKAIALFPGVALPLKRDHDKAEALMLAHIAWRRFAGRAAIPEPSPAEPETATSPDLVGDTPIAGFYRLKLIRFGVPAGVRIWNGPPADPVTGEDLDRAPRWQAQCNGDPIDVERVWPQCARDPIDAAEYAHLAERQAWAKTHAPGSALAEPRRRADFLQMPIPWEDEP